MDELKKYKIADQDRRHLHRSDNGPAKEGGVDPAFFKSAGALRGIKRDLHEGGIRVPFIVRWPEAVKAGSTSAPALRALGFPSHRHGNGAAQPAR